jgi:preprotein translocase subunit SecG
MTVFPILAVSFIMNVVAVLFVICCVSLVLIILIQKGRGGGLSGAFGGAMAGGGILGSKTGDFLTWVTIGLVGLFLTLAVVMAKFYKPSVASDYDVSPQTQQQPLESPEQPEPSDAAGDTTGDTGDGADINSPGS